MIYRSVFIFCLLSTVLLTACFKEDERIPPYDRGDKLTMVIEMTQNYKYQIYCNLDQNQVVSTNLKRDMDLLFETSPASHYILLNSANFMTASATGKFSLDEVTSDAGLTHQFDPSSGNLDSLAIANWISINGTDTTYSHEVFVIDRGYDELGNLLGKKKITFDSLVANRLYFTFANLNGSDLTSGMIAKTPESNFAYYSFNNEGLQVFPEPSKTSYDLLFSQYTTLLFTNEGIPYPYLVTGVLLNRFNTMVALDSITPFDSITLDMASEMAFSNQLDAIGYNWKDVIGDVETGNVFYEVKPSYGYIIRNHEDMYFKLRFVNFYSTEGDSKGEKGYPTFEFQRL
ncbi:MAG: HmuY family protein [Bacteroidales bacterium]|nr:HmuY family protein [Bacteroidales bacterium]